MWFHCAGSVPCINSNTSSVTLLCIVLPWSDIVRGCAGAAHLAYPSEKWVLAERTHLSRGESGWEAYGVRKSPARSHSDWLKRVEHSGDLSWHPSMRCLQKIRGRSDNPPLVRGYPPFLGRRVVIHSGITRGRPVGTVGTVLGGFRSPGGRIRGFPGRRGFTRGKSCRRGRTCRRGRDCRRGRYCRRCGNSFGGDKHLDDYYIITVLRESYIEGTTFSGGLPAYVSNCLVDMMIV